MQRTRIYTDTLNNVVMVETYTGKVLPPIGGIENAGGSSAIAQIWEIDFDDHADGRFTRANELKRDLEKPPGAAPPRFKTGATRVLTTRRTPRQV